MPTVHSEDFGAYADTAALLAVWSETDPGGVMAVDLDATHTLTSSAALRMRIAGTVTAGQTYRASRTVTGLAPGVAYTYRRSRYALAAAGLFSFPGVWHAPADVTVTASSAGTIAVTLDVNILTGGVVDWTVWWDGVAVEFTGCGLTGTHIAFADAEGVACLSNGKPAPADRFGVWEPDIEIVGPRKASLKTGTTQAVAFRTDYTVRFELAHIPAETLPIVVRLKRHLHSGGSCTVVTGDSAGRVHTCKGHPGRVPVTQVGYDRRFMEYVYSFELKNAAAAIMECLY